MPLLFSQRKLLLVVNRVEAGRLLGGAPAWLADIPADRPAAAIAEDIAAITRTQLATHQLRSAVAGPPA